MGLSKNLCNVVYRNTFHYTFHAPTHSLGVELLGRIVGSTMKEFEPPDIEFLSLEEFHQLLLEREEQEELENTK